MIFHRICPVCRSSSIEKALTVKDYTVSGELFDIWQCASCTLRFTQDIPESGDIGKYYRSESYISHTNSGKGLINSLYLFVRKFTLRSKRHFVEKIVGRKRGSLLDVGAGTGAFVLEMKNAGWTVEGVEPDAEAIRNARELHAVDLKPADDMFQLPENSFDAITLWHVLEHVHDLHGYFEQLKKLCHAGGRIFVAVPNYTSLDARIYRQHWAAYDVPRHLYHFSPVAMNALAAAHQCRVEQIQPMWFDSFYVSMLSEKYRSGSLVSGVWSGLRSNLKAMSKRNLASSLIYVIAIS